MYRLKILSVIKTTAAPLTVLKSMRAGTSVSISNQNVSYLTLLYIFFFNVCFIVTFGTFKKDSTTVKNQKEITT